MKKIISLFAVMAIALSMVLPVAAADGNVIYDGNARDFIFAPGSTYSPSDLFPDLKDVMPGDVLTQKITVKNDMPHNVNIKVYLRALGAQEDSVDFLSQLSLKVEQEDGATTAELFDAAAHETAGLTDWVCLGEFRPGGGVDLTVTLTVPVELDDAFQQKVGYLDWEFMVEEFPQGGGYHPPAPIPTATPAPGSEGAPKTGDFTNMELYIFLMLGSVVAAAVLFITQKRGKDEDSQN